LILKVELNIARPCPPEQSEGTQSNIEIFHFVNWVQIKHHIIFVELN